MIGIVVCIAVMLVLQTVTLYWWWIMVVPFGYALVALKSGSIGFRTGLLSAGLLWLAAGGYALVTSSDIVAGRIAGMLQLGGSGWLVLLVTAVVAGLAGGISGMTGSLLRAVFSAKE